MQAFKVRVDAAHASRFKSRSRGGKSGGGGDTDLYALDADDADLLDANDGSADGGAAAMPLTSALGVHSVSVRVFSTMMMII